MNIEKFDFSIDIMQALLWQHSDALNLQSILQQKQDWTNSNYTDFWTNWYNDVFNLDTANEFGLQVWAIVLGITLSPTSEGDSQGKPIFGFGAIHKNFRHGVFSSVRGTVFNLSTDQKRLVLKLRYRQLTSRGSVPEINQMLAELFVSGAWVLDPGDMTFVTYVFPRALDTATRFILDTYDLLPRPAGVGVQYRIDAKVDWGFGIYHKNFSNGIFGAH